MKKTLLFVLIMTVIGTYAQNNDNYLPSAGNRSFEVSFNPGNIFGSGGDAFSLINGNFKFRQFSSAQDALRAGACIYFNSQTEIIQQENTDLDRKELKSYATSYGITLMPGIEKHLNGSNRVSPYVGVQGLLGLRNTSFTEEYQDGDKIETQKITNGGAAGNGYFSLGAGVFTGVDYYFIKHFYVGLELGIGLQYFSLAKSTYTDSGDSDNNSITKNGHYIQLAPGLTTGNIRLGWTF